MHAYAKDTQFCNFGLIKIQLHTVFGSYEHVTYYIYCDVICVSQCGFSPPANSSILGQVTLTLRRWHSLKTKVCWWRICLTQTNKCITISTEMTDLCFRVVIKNVKDHPNYPHCVLLVTGLLISVRVSLCRKLKRAKKCCKWESADQCSSEAIRGVLMYN